MAAFGFGIDLVPTRMPVPSGVFDFVGDVLPAGASVTRASAGWRTNAAGVLVSEGVDIARFDHDPATLAPGGLLLEAARINTLTFSDQFDNAVWNKIGATVTTNDRVAPDGTTTADRLVLTGGGYLQRLGVGTGGATMSAALWLYATSAMSGVQFGFHDSVSGSQYLTFALAAGTWTRVAVTRTLGAGATDRRMLLIPPAAGATLWAWGAQGETNASASSYIPTAGATASRSADLLTLMLGMADGPATLRVTFDDLSTQDIGVTVSGGSATLSGAALVRPRVRRIERL